MKLTKALAIATALAFIAPPSFAATNDLPQDAAEQRKLLGIPRLNKTRARRVKQTTHPRIRGNSDTGTSYYGLHA